MQQRSDDRLIAYLDGELEMGRRREVEAWLDTDPAARQRMAALAESTRLLRRALDEVRRALDRLPPDQRTALLLVTVEGLSYKETAEIVQVPVGTIMSRLSRARIALQLQLEAAPEGRRSTKDAAAQ